MVEQPNMKFAELIYERRVERGISQTHLSDLIETTRECVSAWERGHRDVPFGKVIRISSVLGIKLKEVLTEEML